MAGLLHPKLRLRRATGLTHGDDKGGGESGLQAVKNGTDPIGVDVVEKVKWQTLAGRLESLNHQDWPQTAAADTNPKHIGERLAVGRLDRSVQDVLTKRLNAVDFAGDVLT